MDQKNYIERMKQRLTARDIDRRQFMSGALATGMTLTAATTLAEKAEAATPKKGGLLTVGVGHGATSDSLDPGLNENNFMASLTFGYNGFMTEVASDGSLQPSVAESWESSPDARTWTFKVRSGVEFHDGRPVAATDVISSINHHRGEDSTSAAKPLVSAIKDITADGADTVIFELEAGNADFPFSLTDPHLPVVPDDGSGKIDWQAKIGCGAYKIDHLEVGVTAELSKHANHWNDAVGHLDNIQMLALIDPNARTSALVSKDVDAIDKVDLKTAGLMGRKPGITMHSVTGTQHYTFPMRTDMAPFDDVNVRRAVKHSVNREELVEKVLFGYGSVGNDHPIGSGQRYYNDELPQTPYDPDKARYYLKQAGLSSLNVSLSAADAAFGGAVDAAVLMQNSAKASGIDIEVVREPNDGYWGDVWMNKAWCACYWSGRPVEDQMFSTAYASGVAWNDTFWSNARFDELLVAARAELDENKRREMYFEMQAILNDEGGVVVPMFASYVFATNDGVGYPERFSSHYDMDGERWMERWWRT